MDLKAALLTRARARAATLETKRSAAKLRRKGAQVSDGAKVHPSVAVRCSGLRVGTGTGINAGCVFKGGGQVEIGRYCSISEFVTLITSGHRTTGPNVLLGLHASHGWKSEMTLTEVPVRIRNAVWLGDRVTVLPGREIGNGAICGAGAIITRDVPPFSIVAGTPARILGYRFTPEVIALLEDLAWWDWSPDRIARNREFFEADLSTMSPGTILGIVRD